MRLARPVLLSLALLALVLPAAGCGGGGTPPPDFPTTTLTLLSRAGLDGQVASDGTTNSAVFPQVGSTPTVFVRGIYVFDLPASLVGRTIDSATLRVDQFSAQASAYAAHGEIKADHINMQGVTALSSAVFAGLNLAQNFGTVSTSAALGVKTLDVTARVQADIDAARINSSYRLHFVTEVGLGQGVAIFSDGEGTSSTAQRPQLVVTFRE